ncbi:tetratricopeptide repeat protein [Bacteroides sedimenti]|uniref:Tetratricopeptide repeat protein n=1 Tax=Bacteroides sedimenti TaxID=2136147 RepID=A0ABN6Z9B9_9BACE
MKKLTTTFIMGLLLSFNQAYAQDFNKKFGELFSKGDTIGQLQLLQKWEKAKNDDPELYVAYFNYYVNKSKKELITLGNTPKGEIVFQIMDKDSTVKEPVGYIYDETYYDKEFLGKGLTFIDKGIERYPSRLDMRFGKVYVFGLIKDYAKFTDEIIKTIDYSAKIDNKWVWTENTPVEDPEKFLLSTVQKYVLQIYNTEDDTLLDNMKAIAEAVLKQNPNHVESLSNLSIVYMLKKEYDKALEALLKAEKIDGKDYIVLSNIAQAYKLKGKCQKAIKYYEKVLKYGDDQSKEYAKQQIELLKKMEK